MMADIGIVSVPLLLRGGVISVWNALPLAPMRMLKGFVELLRAVRGGGRRQALKLRL